MAAQIVLAPPFTALTTVAREIRGSAIGLAGQDMHWEKQGAFTGAISGAMLVDAGCGLVIIGHSERRQYFGETDETVNRKIKAALKADPQMAQAAYNLCVITSKDRINEAVNWCRLAATLRPQEPRYAYTLAFYINQEGDRSEAVRILKALLEKYPGYKDAEMLLRELERKP